MGRHKKTQDAANIDPFLQRAEGYGCHCQAWQRVMETISQRCQWMFKAHPPGCLYCQKILFLKFLLWVRFSLTSFLVFASILRSWERSSKWAGKTFDFLDQNWDSHVTFPPNFYSGFTELPILSLGHCTVDRHLDIPNRDPKCLDIHQSLPSN